MPLHLDIDRRAGLIRVTMAGDVSAAEFMAFRRELVKHPNYSPTLPRILDTRAVTLPPSTPEIQQLANAMLWRGERLQARRAIVADRDVLYGMFRMLETMVDLEGGEPVHVFRTEEEALQWLWGARRMRKQAPPQADRAPVRLRPLDQVSDDVTGLAEGAQELVDVAADVTGVEGAVLEVITLTDALKEAGDLRPDDGGPHGRAAEKGRMREGSLAEFLDLPELALERILRMRGAGVPGNAVHRTILIG